MWNRNGFQLLVDILPPEHKARWLAGAVLTAADQAMASVMSTVLSRLNAFLDTELEQVICYDSPINAEMFASEKCAIFLILPEEDPAKNFIAGLMIQNLSRELFSVADEHDGMAFEFIFEFIKGCHVFYLTRIPSPAISCAGNSLRFSQPFLQIRSRFESGADRIVTC